MIPPGWGHPIPQSIIIVAWQGLRHTSKTQKHSFGNNQLFVFGAENSKPLRDGYAKSNIPFAICSIY
jgi:hypothetical protein